MEFCKISFTTYTCVMLLLSINKDKIATATCPETSSPVLKMCENGDIRHTQIYVDGSTAAGVTATECRCTILLHDGGQVTWTQLNKPGYDSCSTDIEISSTTQNIIFGCHGGGYTMNTLPAASTISLTLHKPTELNSQFAANYCYRISENSFSSNLTVRCCDPSDQVCVVDSHVTEPTAKPVTTPEPIITTQQQTTAKLVTTQQPIVTMQQPTMTKKPNPITDAPTTVEELNDWSTTQADISKSTTCNICVCEVLSEKNFPVEIVVPVIVIAILFCVTTVVGAVIYVRRERTSMKDQTYDRHVTVAGKDDHQYEDIGQRSDYVIPS